MGKLLLKIKTNYSKMSKQEKKISDFLFNADLSHPYTITELSKATNVSEATIVRYSKSLGFIGYPDFKLALSREERSVTNISIDIHDSGSTIYSKVSDDIYSTLLRTKEYVNDEQIAKSSELIESSKNIGIFGVGNSSIVAADFQHKLMRLGFNAHAYSDSYLQLICANNANEHSLIIAVSHSGLTKEIIENVTRAKENKAKIILITSNKKSPIFPLADVTLLTSSEETNYRLLGLISRFAQLAIFDTIYSYITMHNEKRRNRIIELEEYLLPKRKLKKV